MDTKFKNMRVKVNGILVDLSVIKVKFGEILNMKTVKAGRFLSTEIRNMKSGELDILPCKSDSKEPVLVNDFSVGEEKKSNGKKRKMPKIYFNVSEKLQTIFKKKQVLGSEIMVLIWNYISGSKNSKGIRDEKQAHCKRKGQIIYPDTGLKSLGIGKPIHMLKLRGALSKHLVSVKKK